MYCALSGLGSVLGSETQGLHPVLEANASLGLLTDNSERALYTSVGHRPSLLGTAHVYQGASRKRDESVLIS